MPDGIPKIPNSPEEVTPAWLRSIFGDVQSARTLHGIDWIMCPPEMQPEENCTTMVERFSTAAVDPKTLDATGTW